MPHEPLLLQSLGNPFIFRCVDGVMIDGNHRGLSRWIYKWVVQSVNQQKEFLLLVLCDPGFFRILSKDIVAGVIFTSMCK